MNSERVIGLCGSGPTAAALAEAAAAGGFVVEMLDANSAKAAELREEAVRRVEARFARGGLSRSDKEIIVSSLRLAQDYGAFARAECVVEAGSEDLELKRKAWAEMDAALPARALRASSTSRLSISRLSEGLAHADRFLGMHPVLLDSTFKVVELVFGASTAEQAMVDGRAICVKLGAVPVKVKDSPGFIGLRVSRPLFLEAMRLVETGETDIRTVDRAMEEIGGMAKGPFALMDQIGLDSELAITESIHADLGAAPHLAPTVLLQRLVGAGHVGRRTGRGFYDYGNGRQVPAFETPAKGVRSWKPTPALGDLAKVLGRPVDRSLWIYARVFMAVVNEAARVAESVALPRDVNQVMELGYGFAEGPLAAADHAGLDVVQRLLREFHKGSEGDQRFADNPLLDKHVADGDLGEKTAKGFLHHSL